MHYNEGLWANFVRGLVPSDLASDMQNHLISGCSRCTALVTSLAAVEDTFSRDRKLPVPPGVVNRARSVFKPSPKKNWRDFPREIASLIVDSSLQPALAGVRSAHAAARHVSFASGHWRVYVQIDQQSPGNVMVLTGQLGSSAQQTTIAGLPVQLLRGERVLAEVLTSEFGEFEFDLPHERNLCLLIAVDAESRLLEINLDRPSGGDIQNEAAPAL